MDPNYKPPAMESRTLYGLTLEQKRNDAVIEESLFTADKIVSKNKNVSCCCTKYSYILENNHLQRKRTFMNV